MTDWSDHYQRTRGNGPHRTLITALSLFNNENKSGLAVDLGCGDGRDSLELLKQGWSVIAIDREAAALEVLKEQLGDSEEAQDRLVCVQDSFETVEIPVCKLVNSSIALPFCELNHFPKLWKKIESSLESGGRFAGHFLGINDDWVQSGTLIYHHPELLQGMFSKFRIDWFDEVERDYPTAAGDMKHWHLFSVVATKV